MKYLIALSTFVLGLNMGIGIERYWLHHKESPTMRWEVPAGSLELNLRQEK